MAVTRSEHYVAPDGVGFEGRRPDPPTSAKALMRLESSHDFMFLVHPALWDVAIVDGQPAIVPRLREFRFEPGIACVEGVKGQFGGNPMRALTIVAERGWRGIPTDIEVKAWGRTVTGYCVRYDGYRGPVHLTAWHRPYVRGNQVVLDHDEEGWNAWRASLVGNVVRPPDPATLRAFELEFRMSLRGLQSSAERSAYAMANAEELERKLLVFEKKPRPSPVDP